MDDHEKSLLKFLPTTSVRQAEGWHYIYKLPELLAIDGGQVSFLDLGAGEGQSRSHLKKAMGDRAFIWKGVDIGDSSEVLKRSDTAPDIDIYDGTKLPYSDDSFDVIWCKQVLEHVRYPDAVIAEVRRTLKPDGMFIGAVSQLEPYHSRSIFNWTHYGIRTVFGDHDLAVIELHPGVDGILLMLRALFGYETPMNAFFENETPINVLLQTLFSNPKATSDQNAISANLSKIKIAGHIHFAARCVKS